MLTTRNLKPADDCQICGNCKRCSHYHQMRREIMRLRKMIRRVVKAQRAWGPTDDGTKEGLEFERACDALATAIPPVKFSEPYENRPS